MNTSRVLAVMLFVAISTVGAAVFGEETSVVEEKLAVEVKSAGEVKAPGKSGRTRGELSYVETSGNSKTTSLAAKNQVKYQFTEKVLGTWKVGAIVGKNDGKKNAENYFTDLKADYHSAKGSISWQTRDGLKTNSLASIDGSTAVPARVTSS